jgi:hypothetical protein
MLRNQNTVIEAAFAETVDPASLVALAELAAEGFGWSDPLVRTPKDAVDALAREFAELVVPDDIGRRCVPRDTARALLAERAAAEERQRAERQARSERRARRSRPVPRGVPAVEGMTAYESMLAASGEDEQKKDLAADRMWRLARGESWGGTFHEPVEE